MQENVAMLRSEEGDMEAVVDLHSSGEGESISGFSNLIDDGQ